MNAIVVLQASDTTKGRVSDIFYETLALASSCFATTSYGEGHHVLAHLPLTLPDAYQFLSYWNIDESSQLFNPVGRFYLTRSKLTDGYSRIKYTVSTGWDATFDHYRGH